MTIRTTVLGGTNWIPNEIISSTDMNDTFDISTGMNPIGIILPWYRHMAGLVSTTLPQGFVECDGTSLSSASSVLNGQTMPDLNNNNRLLQGSTSSGITGGTTNVILPHNSQTNVAFERGGNDQNNYASHAHDNRPAFFNVVYIIKVS